MIRIGAKSIENLLVTEEKEGKEKRGKRKRGKEEKRKKRKEKRGKREKRWRSRGGGRIYILEVPHRDFLISGGTERMLFLFILSGALPDLSR